MALTHTIQFQRMTLSEGKITVGCWLWQHVDFMRLVNHITYIFMVPAEVLVGPQCSVAVSLMYV